MFRLFIPFIAVWIFFDFINVIFLGQLTSREDVGEEQRQKWFLFAIIGGPIFTIIAFLMYFFHSSEKHYTDVEEQAKLDRQKKAYEDIFEDEN